MSARTDPVPVDSPALGRRAALTSLAAAGAGLLLTRGLLAESGRTETSDPTLLRQDLPDVALKGWQMSALDIPYAPGEMDKPHRHPGFVFGYVIEGSIRFQVDGGPETVYHAGQMFYEAPGGVHRVSGNASATRPARLLAMVFADKSSPTAGPV